MSLHPQVRAFLDMVASLEGSELYEMPAPEARKRFAVLTAGGTPEERAQTKDLAIPGPGGPIPVRIYTPEGSGPFPVIVYFHGGSFILGDLQTCDTLCHRLCASVGAVIVNVDYRLAPEHPFPAGLDDAFAVATWVSGHAAEIDGDPSRIALAGNSAGANLVAVTCLRARDRGGPNIAFQLMLSPIVDFTGNSPSRHENAEGYVLTAADLKWTEGHYIPEGIEHTEPELSPIFAKDLSRLPPALVITAEFDPLRDEGETYVRLLREAGTQADLTRYDGMIHGFYLMDSLDASRVALRQIVQALQEAFAR